jgi:hypothetical protein
MESENLIEIVAKLKSDNEQMKRIINSLMNALSVFEEEYKSITPIITNVKELLTEIEKDDK